MGKSILALALFLLGATTASDATQIGIGVNYNWWKFALASLHECKASADSRSVGTWILPHYNDPQVRRVVNRQLRAMRDAGFTTLRIMVFHDHSLETDSTDSLTSLDGSLTPSDRSKLRNFVGDIASAGYASLEIVDSFQAENWIYCRDREWGDCFDARRTNENARFISEVATTAIDAAGAMPVRFDLTNEAAPDPRMPPAALAKAKAYLQTIARRFQAEFGDRWLISAARSDLSPATETRDRVELLLRYLAEAGLHPKYLEIHNYSADGNDVKESLDEAQAIAKRIGAYVVLGEMRYHSGVQASALAGWLEKNPASRVVDAIEWPQYDPSQICAIDPVPPYTPGSLKTIERTPGL